MSPITTLKRRSTPNTEEKPAQKRSKLSPIELKPRPNGRASRELAVQSLAHANSLSSETFTNTYISKVHRTFTTKDGERTYLCNFRRTQDLTSEEREACYQMVKETSQTDYEANAEEGWDEHHKREEMEQPNMRFILIREAPSSPRDEGTRLDTPSESLDKTSSQPLNEKDDTILGFTSFVVELDPDNSLPQLYIYEIHLLPSLRGLGLGRHLMSLNEDIAKKIGLEKCILTVFTCNLQAEGMYRALGYEDDECCPATRVLRDGRVRRPKYLILSKSL